MEEKKITISQTQYITLNNLQKDTFNIHVIVSFKIGKTRLVVRKNKSEYPQVVFLKQ